MFRVNDLTPTKEFDVISIYTKSEKKTLVINLAGIRIWVFKHCQMHLSSSGQYICLLIHRHKLIPSLALKAYAQSHSK